MQAVVTLAARVAQVDSTVLITGESGVGKERLARFIHTRSRRTKGPFTPVNCGALTDSLAETELFGHSRGAFTGAVAYHAGLFESADGGTILLDEVAELSLAIQVKLLRVLQEREVRRVGDTKQRTINVRVIAATNRHLADDVAHHRFREDLYYRLKVVELEVPPLRQRTEDLPVLAETILARVSSHMAKPIAGYTGDALDAILRYTWPGNVRELENAIERACALAAGPEITVHDLPAQVRADVAISNAEVVRRLCDVERDHILATLRRNGGNKTLTAEQLHIAVATLFRKLKRYAPAAE